ncbi:MULTISPECIES: aldo/keto reductase family oxidoreductase [unclassified Leucobacter]|uniref:aldo/keto reductase n=1 Tax=unclassified Leucobacter TaxID=2621730 RepID=UPI001F144715|nr:MULTISPECIES: aldo/keto reductase [unclassified Leucobacter]
MTRDMTDGQLESAARQPALMLGMMRAEELDAAALRALVSAALDVGVQWVDHADIYGSGWHGCEAHFGAALQSDAGARAALKIQTKCGIVRGESSYDLSYAHIVRQVEGSLRALRIDTIDSLLLHRPDALCEPDEVARAFDELEASGKVRAFGVSNHTARQIERLRGSVRQPLVVNQVQLSLAHAPAIAQGIAANIAGEEQSVMRDDGVLDYCRATGIAVQAWGPLQSPIAAGSFLGAPEHAALNTEISRVAAAHGVGELEVAVSWIARHPSRPAVVLGSTRPERVRAAVRGTTLELSRSDWYGLFRAAGYEVP